LRLPFIGQLPDRGPAAPALIEAITVSTTRSGDASEPPAKFEVATADHTGERTAALAIALLYLICFG
jgi:hypothetical protein